MGIVKDFINANINKIFGSGLTAVGIGGYIAGVRIKETVTRTSRVATATVEDGSVLNDHIINNPILLSIEGEVGNIEIQNKVRQSPKSFSNPIGAITSFLPDRTQNQLREVGNAVSTVSNIVDKIDNLSDISSIFDLFSPLTTREEKLRFYQHFERLYQSKSLVSVEMVDKTYDNMAITYFQASEYGGNYVGFKMNLQEVRIAKTLSVSNSELHKNPSTAAKTHTTAIKKKGTVFGKSKGTVTKKEGGTQMESFAHSFL